MKTFKDLKFKKHPNCDIGEFKKQCKMHFENGYGVSVITGGYGSVENPYELAVLKKGRLCYTTSITDDIIGYLNEDGVSELMIKVQEL